MKYLILLPLFFSTLWGCSYHWFEEPYPDILEAEKQQVNGCAMLGVVSETANAGNPIPISAKETMILKVRERAGQLGATHIVWLHKTSNMATAQAYDCP